MFNLDSYRENIVGSCSPLRFLQRIFKTKQQIALELVDKQIDKGTRFDFYTSSVYDVHQVLKSDVSIAKNYLNKKEIDELNRIVTMYLDKNMNKRIGSVQV